MGLGWLFAARRYVGVPVLGKLVLPPDDVDRPHVAHAHVPEERYQLVVDDVFLGDPGVLAYARLHLGGVHLNELGERHVHGPVVRAFELAFPHGGLHLGGEAALCLVALRAARVAVVALHVERTVVVILVLLTWEILTPFPPNTAPCLDVLKYGE